MWDKFGEFDSVEELNRAAAAQLAEGDRESLIALAEENGIDKEDAEDYMDGYVDQLATPLMAAVGKLMVESEQLELKGVLTDWKDTVVEMCGEDETAQRAVRKKGKNLRDCLAAMLKFAFENKVQVSDKIVNATKVEHNGKVEQMRGPLYLGVPDRNQVKRLIKAYYEMEEFS